jgi:hypothetical protein
VIKPLGLNTAYAKPSAILLSKLYSAQAFPFSALVFDLEAQVCLGPYPFPSIELRSGYTLVYITQEFPTAFLLAPFLDKA